MHLILHCIILLLCATELVALEPHRSIIVNANLKGDIIAYSHLGAETNLPTIAERIKTLSERIEAPVCLSVSAMNDVPASKLLMAFPVLLRARIEPVVKFSVINNANREIGIFSYDFDVIATRPVVIPIITTEGEILVEDKKLPIKIWLQAINQKKIDMVAVQVSREVTMAKLLILMKEAQVRKVTIILFPDDK